MLPSLLRAPETVVSLLVVTFVSVMHVTRGNSWIAMALDVLIYAGAALVVLWPRATAIGVGATLAVLLSLPNGTLILGEYAVAIPIFSAAVRGHSRVAYIASAAYMAIFLIDVAYRYQGAEAFGTILFWITFLGTFLLLAHGLVRAQARQARIREAEAAHDRARLSQDLHNDVASALTRIFMRTQLSRLNGTAADEDVAYIADEAGTALRQLRQVVEALHETPDPPQPQASSGPGIGADILQDCAARLHRHGFDPLLRIDSCAAQYNAVVAAALRATATEAVNNIIRHGDPSRPCELALVEGHAAAMIMLSNSQRVGDHPINDAPPPHNHAPLGLAGMRARIEAVGGALQADMAGEKWVLRAICPTRVATPQLSSHEG